MARPLRIDQEETFYHVLNRGNERRALFRDERDYEGFLDRLGRCLQRFGLRVFAYVLMGNHYHLLWRQGRFRLGQIAEHFGVGDSAVSHACRRAEQRLQTDRKLQSQLKGLPA